MEFEKFRVEIENFHDSGIGTLVPRAKAIGA